MAEYLFAASIREDQFNYLFSEHRRINFFHIQNGNDISQKLFQIFLC